MPSVTALNAGVPRYGRALLVAVVAALVAPIPALATSGGGDLVGVIVSFEGPPGREGKQAVREAGGWIKNTFRLIDAVSADLPRGRIAALERNPRVIAVELDHRIEAFHHGPNTGNPELEAAWGVEHIGAGAVHLAGNTGQDVKVGVIDTGIYRAHTDLSANYAGGWDFFNGDDDPTDDHGHGTHVAGSIAAVANASGVVGVAPDVRLYAYKVLGADGSGDYSNMIAALEQAVLDDVDVVNMSLGGTEDSVALHNEIIAAYNAGIILVAASGNVGPSGQACPVAYPAAYEEVFATTFTGPDDALTGYSCTGPQVDFASPGDNINSTVPPCPMAMCNNGGYTLAAGTSMASPHLAGTVALMLSHGITNSSDGESWTLADDVKEHLCTNTAVGTGVTYFGFWHVPISPTDPRYPDWFGCGVIDAQKALLTNPPPTDGGPTNSAPIAANDTASVAEDGSVSVAVLANDTDADGDALSVASVGSAVHGTAVADGAGNVVYTPAADYSGSDSFTYQVTDGDASDAGTVAVDVTAVNDAPVATDDTAESAHNGSVNVDVLANDADVDGDALVVSAVGQPARGTAAVVDGQVLYTAASGYAGADSFTYEASDGRATDTATVTVTVRANGPPVAVDDTAAVVEDGSVSVDVLANDTDSDDDTLNIGAVGAPANGSAAVINGQVVYTPIANFSGSDSFTYEASDGRATDTATVTVSVAPVNDAPVANSDSSTTTEARPITINVLANDSDQEADILTLTSVTQPGHGAASMSGGSVLYSPAPTFSGVDSFDYTVSDGNGGSATASVTVSVAATPRQMHVGDLDATATRQTTRWAATVTIRIRNSTGSAVSNVRVTGTWSTGESVSCTTGTGGNCTVTKSKIALSRASVTFTITSATRSGWLYVPAANLDPEADSNGTTIVIARP